ncbi:hypothetical protein AB3480_06580 [Rhizobium mongolense]|uniref:hypothetical protein n=1 Tax=Rhizobium mongolense TaxID=57676 RepID=UPI0034A34F2A
MNEYFVLLASCICLVIGIAFCFPPIERYRGSRNVGAFGTTLVILGVVLMTTFKWTDVAIKISGLEFKLQAAQQEAGRLSAALSDKENALMQLSMAAGKSSQKRYLDSIITSVQTETKNTADSKTLDLVKQAFDKSDYSVVPTGSVPVYSVDSGQRLNPS